MNSLPNNKYFQHKHTQTQTYKNKYYSDNLHFSLESLAILNAMAIIAFLFTKPQTCIETIRMRNQILNQIEQETMNSSQNYNKLNKNGTMLAKMGSATAKFETRACSRL